MPERYVISVGGSVMVPDRIDVQWIRKFGRVIDYFFDHGIHFALVAGGGRIARDYSWAVRLLGGSKTLQDQAGILATKMNAWLLISALDSAYPEPLSDIWRAKAYMGKWIPVVHGATPGVTSDYAAALIAEATGATFVNITNVDGVFARNPFKDPTARLLERLTHDEFVSLVEAVDTRDPGAHTPMDIAAAKILQRSKIRTYVVGKDLHNLHRLLEGKSFKGTTITSR